MYPRNHRQGEQKKTKIASMFAFVSMGGVFVRLSKAIRMESPLAKPNDAEESIASTRTTTGDLRCAPQDPVKLLCDREDTSELRSAAFKDPSALIEIAKLPTRVSANGEIPLTSIISRARVLGSVHLPLYSDPSEKCGANSGVTSFSVPYI